MNKGKHLTRKSYFDYSRTINDKGQQLGFDYHNKILKKTTSSLFYRDDKREKILTKFGNILEYLVDYVKEIKKTYHFAIDRKSKKIN